MPSWLGTLPNALTVFRILVLPLIAIAIETGHGFTAMLVLAFAGITDLLDGWIARRWGLETPFGKLMDPVADKLMLCVAILFLVARDPRFAPAQLPLSPWLGLLLLAREFLVTGLRAVAAGSGIVMGAGQTGKIKTLFQNVGMGAIMIGGRPAAIPAHDLGLVLLWISVLLSYWSMVKYSSQAYRDMKTKLIN